MPITLAPTTFQYLTTANIPKTLQQQNHQDNKTGKLQIPSPNNFSKPENLDSLSGDIALLGVGSAGGRGWSCFGPKR